jgi:hypothetical protein
MTFVAIYQPSTTNNNSEVITIANLNLNMKKDHIFNLRQMINMSVLIKSLQNVIG